jgi:hypothetical protein
MKATSDRVIAKILSNPSKDKPTFTNLENKWYRGIACHSKTKSGVRYRRFVRLHQLIS